MSVELVCPCISHIVYRLSIRQMENSERNTPQTLAVGFPAERDVRPHSQTIGIPFLRRTRQVRDMSTRPRL